MRSNVGRNRACTWELEVGQVLEKVVDLRLQEGVTNKGWWNSASFFLRLGSTWNDVTLLSPFEWSDLTKRIFFLSVEKDSGFAQNDVTSLPPRILGDLFGTISATLKCRPLWHLGTSIPCFMSWCCDVSGDVMRSIINFRSFWTKLNSNSSAF